MVFKYCAECGHKLDEIRLGDDDCKICPACKRIYGNNPLPVVEVLVLFHVFPSVGKWVLLGIPIFTTSYYIS